VNFALNYGGRDEILCSEENDPNNLPKALTEDKVTKNTSILS
jgi:hypothetical protein